jgi:hypothetical protein
VNINSTYVSEINDVAGNPFEFYIHSISDKVSLMNLLTAPLYYIFPIGTNSLSTDNTPAEHATNLTSWLKSNYKLVENRRDFLVNASNLKCQTKFYFVSKTNKDFVFNEEEKNHLLSVNKVYSVWNNMQTTIDNFVNGIDNNISMFPMAKDAAGCDLIMLLREIENNKIADDDDDNDVTDDGNNNIVENLGVIHVIAIELKDRRNTEETEWQKKIELLTSHRCILPRLRAALLNKGFKDVQYHIVFAGREHD